MPDIAGTVMCDTLSIGVLFNFWAGNLVNIVDEVPVNFFWPNFKVEKGLPIKNGQAFNI